MDHRSGRRGLVAVTLVLGLALAGCSGGEGRPEGDPATLQSLAEAELASDPGVERVEVVKEPIDGAFSMAVVMAPDADVDQVAAAADAGRRFSVEHVTDTRWSTTLYLGDPLAGAEDQPAGVPVQIELHPTIRREAGTDARAAMSLISLPGVDRVAVASGTPYVTMTDASALAAVLPGLRAHELWSEGGSVEAESGRIRLMDEPKRVTAVQLAAIIRAAVDHPAGEFWLEAAATGERYPHLNVNRVTTDEAAEVTRRFTSSDVASDSTDGFELEFTMRAQDPADPNQPVDSFGTFGQVG